MGNMLNELLYKGHGSPLFFFLKWPEDMPQRFVKGWSGHFANGQQGLEPRFKHLQTGIPVVLSYLSCASQQNQQILCVPLRRTCSSWNHGDMLSMLRCLFRFAESRF